MFLESLIKIAVITVIIAILAEIFSTVKITEVEEFKKRKMKNTYSLLEYKEDGKNAKLFIASIKNKEVFSKKYIDEDVTIDQCIKEYHDFNNKKKELSC